MHESVDNSLSKSSQTLKAQGQSQLAEDCIGSMVCVVTGSVILFDCPKPEGTVRYDISFAISIIEIVLDSMQSCTVQFNSQTATR